MRYMMMVMGDADFEAGKPASDELQALMGEYIGRMAAEGIFVDGAGLMPSSQGFKAHARNGEISFTDGPFTEAKEIIGGYAIVDVRDEAHAREVVREFIGLHTRTGYTDVTCEIRRMEDAPAAE